MFSVGISFDCKKVVSAIRATDSENDIEIYPDATGGDSSDKGIHGDGGGGSGGGKGGRGDNDGNSGEGEESNDSSRKKALSMSQKLTLGYAVLVGGSIFHYLFPFFCCCKFEAKVSIMFIRNVL